MGKIKLLLVLFFLLLGPAWAQNTAQKIIEPIPGKVLILYAPGGHESASKQVKNLLEARGMKVALVNTHDFFPPLVGKAYHSFYVLFMKHFPKILSLGYEQMMKEADKAKSVDHLMQGKGYNLHRLAEKIRKERPSVVLTTIGLAIEPWQRAKNSGYFADLPLGYVVTDYDLRKYWTELLPKASDMTFAPHIAFEKASIASGVLPAKVQTSGMPVNPSVFEPISDVQIEKIYQKLGFKKTVPTLVLSGGTAGVGDFPAMIRSVQESFIKSSINPAEVQVLAAVGKNETLLNLLQKLRKKLPSNINLQIKGFDPELPFVLKALDAVIVTKPGGLSITENALLEKPMILLETQVSNEAKNRELFASEGMAQKATHESVGHVFKDLVDHPEKIEAMRDSQRVFKKMQNPGAFGDWVEGVMKAQKSGALPMPKIATSPEFPILRRTVVDCIKSLLIF